MNVFEMHKIQFPYVTFVDNDDMECAQDWCSDIFGEYATWSRDECDEWVLVPSYGRWSLQGNNFCFVTESDAEVFKEKFG